MRETRYIRQQCSGFFPLTTPCMYFFQFISTYIFFLNLGKRQRKVFFPQKGWFSCEVFMLSVFPLSGCLSKSASLFYCSVQKQQCWHVGYGCKENTFRAAHCCSSLISFLEHHLLHENYSDKNNCSLARWLTQSAAMLRHGGVLLRRLTVTQQSNNTLVLEQWCSSTYWVILKNLCASVRSSVYCKDTNGAGLVSWLYSKNSLNVLHCCGAEKKGQTEAQSVYGIIFVVK